MEWYVRINPAAVTGDICVVEDVVSGRYLDLYVARPRRRRVFEVDLYLRKFFGADGGVECLYPETNRALACIVRSLAD